MHNKDNGTAQYTVPANGKDPRTFFDRPTSVVPKAWIGICVLNR